MNMAKMLLRLCWNQWRSESPRQGYLEEVKDLAHKNGSLLIFDEVSCGWRMS